MEKGKGKSVGADGSDRTNKRRRNAARKLIAANKPTVEQLEARVLLSASLPAGSLDPTFNLNGKLVANPFGSTSANAYAVGIEANSSISSVNGDIVVAGVETTGSTSEIAVALYSSTGSFVAQTTATAGALGVGQINALQIDSNGNIVVAGDALQSGDTADFLVARFEVTDNGEYAISLDSSFGTGGIVLTNVSTSHTAVANALAFTSSGNIIAAGDSYGTSNGSVQHAAFVEYNSAGTVLSQVIDTNNSGQESATGVVVESSGNILAVGQKTGEGETFLLTNTSNTLAFQNTQSIASTSALSAIAAAPFNGEYIIAGQATSGDSIVAEVTAAGALDSSFGTGGETQTSFGSMASEANAVVVTDVNGNEKIYAVGYETDPTSSNQFIAVARYTPSGALDAAFGTGGTVVTDLLTSSPGSAYSYGQAAVIDPQGRLVVAGYTDSSGSDSFAVVRYVTNNAPTDSNLSATTSFSAIDQGDDNTPGNTVTQLVDGFGFTDADGDTIGIAITSVDDTNGTWQYSTNGGSVWSAITASATSALLLSNSPSNLIRFDPTTISATAYTASITLAAWDETQYSSGQAEDTTATDVSQSENLNTFSVGAAFTASVDVEIPQTVYVDASWAGSAQDQSVTDPGFGPQTYGIDAFSDIQSAINDVASGGIVQVAPGTYAGNIVISTPNVSLVGPQANANVITRFENFNGFNTSDPKANAGSEAILTPSTVAPGNSNLITVLASGVTINGFTLDGNNASLGTSAVTDANGLNLDASDAIANFTNDGTGNSDGNSTVVPLNNLTVEYNVIQNFAERGVDLSGSNSSDATGSSITENLIRNYGFGDPFGGFGVILWLNEYANVTYNVIDVPQTSLGNSGIYIFNFNDGQQAVTNSMTVSNNTVTVGQDGIGIIANLFYNYEPGDSNSALTICYNTVNADSGVVAGDGRTFGIVVQSQGAGTSVSVDGNIVGANGVLTVAGGIGDGGTFDAGMELVDNALVSVSGGSVASSLVGIDVNADDSGNLGTGAVDANISDVSITGGTDGIRVNTDDTGDGDASADISDDTITGAATGILVQAPSGTNNYTSSVTISGDTAISGGTTGIEIIGPNASLIFSGDVAASLFDLSGNYITLDDGAMGGLTPDVMDATDVSFGGLGAMNVNTTLAQYYAIENKITDYLDYLTLGYVELNATNVYVEQNNETATADSIQRGINVAGSGDTVNVQAGTYTGTIQINKSVILAGANATANPTNEGPRGAETILEPSISGGNAYSSTPTFLIEVLASNVTIEGFTLTGENNALGTSGNPNAVALTETGATPIYAQASEGIATFNPLAIPSADITGGSGVISGNITPGNITIQNNIIEDLSYQGVDLGWDTSGTVATSGSLVSQNLIQNIGAYNDEGDAVRLRQNLYASVTGNQILNVRMGVETGNYFLANPGATAVIEDNQIQARRRGIFYNLSYGAASVMPIEYNTITATADDPSIVATASLWTGIYVISQQGSNTASFLDNSINGTGASYSTTAGYTLLDDWATDNVIIAGDTNPDNSISNVTYGIWETTGDPNGLGANASANLGVTINGVNISASQSGVYVQEDPSYTNYSVSATIDGDTEINTGGTGTGIEVSGDAASATITGNDASIDDNSTGILVSGGSATITGNHIYDNATGIEFTAGGSGSVADNNFTGSTDNDVDLLIGNSAGTVTDGGGNQFAAVDYYIENFSTNTIDATDDTFGGINPSGMDTTLAQLFTIEDQILDGVDIDGAGLVRIVADNVYTTPTSTYAGDTNNILQRAVNVADAGDTINVENGTYVGQVLIAKDLTLLGQSESGVVVQADTTMSDAFTDDGANNPIVYVGDNATSTIQNLTVDGAGDGNAYGDGFEGIAFFDAGGTVNDVTIEHVTDTPFDGAQGGIALFADSDDNTARSLTVTNNDIFDYQKNGMALSGAGLTVDVEYNTVTGNGATSLNAQNGIQLGYTDGGQGLIAHNTVSGDTYEATEASDYDATAILLYDTSGTTTVCDNTISSSDVGIYGEPATGAVTISGNTITTADAAGIVAYDGQFTISGNSVENGVAAGYENTADGIDIYDDNNSTTAVVDNNILTGDQGDGLGIYGAARVLAQGNTLTGDGEGVLISGGATVDLGDASGDADFTGLGSSTGQNILTGYSGTPDNYAIDDQNTTAGAQPNVLAEDDNFGPYSANDLSAIGQVINDSADNSTLTTVDYLPALDEQAAPLTVYVNSGWADSAFGSNPGPAGAGNSIGYDEFSNIQSAIDAVANSGDGTVEIDNGTYDPSNILVNIPVTIEGQSESGVVITPSLADSHDDSSFGGTASNGFIIASSGVTIEDLTLDGGADQNFRDGIITNSQNDGNTYSNITIENVDIENVFRKGIAIYNETGIATGIVIENDTLSDIGTTIDDGGSAYEATSAIAVFGSDATIESNVITNSAGGIEANTFDGSAQLLTISNNQISAPRTVLTNGALGIDVASLAGGSVVSGNTIDLTGGAGNDIGIVVSYDHGTVTVSGNGITGVDGDDGILLYQDATPVAVSGNTITGSSDSGTGILVTAQNGDTTRFGDTPGAVAATLTGNSIGGYANGIEVVSDGQSGDTASANIGDGTDPDSNTISGASVGVLVNGSLASADIDDNHIYDNATGIEFTADGSGSVTDNNFSGSTDNGVDLLLNTGAGTVIIGDGNQFAATNYYIEDLASGNFDLNNDPNTVFGSNPILGDLSVPADLSAFYGIEDKIVDYLDNPNDGYVRLKDGFDFITQLSDQTTAGAIQRAVNIANTDEAAVPANGDSVYVQAGTYIGEVDIETSLTLLGAQAGMNPNSSAPAMSMQTIIEPDAADANPNDNNSVTMVYVGVSNVTIDGVTIDGNNPNLAPNANTTSSNGVTLDASVGLASYQGVGNIIFKNSIVENLGYAGIDLYNYYNSGGVTTDNVITDNLIQNISDFYGYGIGVLVYNNFYAQITDNVMTALNVGVQTGNFSQANPDDTFAPEISGNQITASGVGIFFNLMYGASSPFTISDNRISAINAPSDAPWQGVLLTSIETNASATFQDNTIDGSNAYTDDGSTPSSGYEVWNTPTTGTVEISGGTVSGVDYGVWVNSYEGYQSPAGPTSVTVNGVDIAATQIGVYVEDSYPKYTSEFENADQSEVPVSAIIEGDATITGAVTGIEISGPDASATITGNILTDNTTGIDVDGGTLTAATGNTITGGTTGIAVDSGTANIGDGELADENTISGAGTGILVDGGAATIAANDITDNTTDGIQLTSGSATVTGNTLADNTTGIEVDGGMLTAATGNTITGGTIGIEVGAGTANIGDGEIADANTLSGASTGILVDGGSASIASNDITGNTTDGIQITSGSATVTGNTLADNTTGIDVDGGTLTTATGNTITGGTIGIEVGAGTANIGDGEIADANTLSGASTGILVDGGSAAIAGNDITNSGVGIALTAGSATVIDNDITSNATGIEVNGTGTLIATGNLISATGDAIEVTAAGSPSVTLSDNSIIGGSYAVANANATVVNASANWWGSNLLSAVSAAITGSVDYSPFLGTGNNSASIGFQGDFSDLYVTDLGAQVGSAGRINEAINDVTTGGTIHVYAGTYDENLDITKALTLESVSGAGSTTLSDPSSPLATVVINSTGVTLNGFTITATAVDWALAVVGLNDAADITNNSFQSSDVGNVLVADASNIIAYNAFVAPAATTFIQYEDSGDVGYSSPSEIPAVLSGDNNTFNRAVTINNAGGDYLGAIWANIQPAIDAASTGDAVTVGAGTYNEEVEITKSLTLQGTEANVNPGDTGRGSDPESTILGLGDNAPILIDSGINDVTINGFTIESPDAGSGNYNSGIYVNGSTGVNIEYNIIDDNTTGIAIADAGGTISNNLIENNNAPGSGSGNGIEFFAASSGDWTISNNYFTDNTSADVLAAPGALTSTVLNLTIENNQMSDSGGIDLYNTGDSLVYENSLSGIGVAAIYLGGADNNIEISQNDISDNPGAAAVEVDNYYSLDANSNISVHNNFLDDNQYGVYVTSGAPSSSMSVSDNHIAGNTMAGLENDSDVTVNADYNWWGNASGPTTSVNPSGTGDAIVGDATFSPWLTSGVDDDDNVADGFQPEAGAAVAISGASTSIEGATYTLTLTPSSDITQWTINWGDGTLANPDTQTVSGSTTSITHVYTEGNNDDSLVYTISATASTASGPVASNDVNVTVVDAPISVTDVGLSTTEGQAFSGPVATLTDGAGTYSNPDDLSATINWGDGSDDTSATLVEDGNTGIYYVEGSHTYAEYGNYTITVDAADDGGSTSSNTGNAAVADAAMQVTGVGLSATKGALFNGQVATLTDDDGTYSHPGDLSAMINWGDGSDPTAATLVETDTPGVYAVDGSHTYANYGDYTVTVDANDTGGSSSSNTGSAVVNDAALTLSLTSPTGVLEGVSTNIPLGTLTDAAGSYSDQNDLSVSINWGDGSPLTTATLVETSTPGVYDIQGTHDYGNDDTYNITLTAADNNGNQTGPAGSTAGPTTTTVAVGYNPPTVDLTGSATSVPMDSTYTLDIGAVTDPGPNDVLGYVINWGDGALTQNVSGGSPTDQNFTHSYDIPITEPITVTIIDSDGSHTAVLSDNDSQLPGAFDVNVTDVPPTATPVNYLTPVPVGSEGLVALTDPTSVSTYETDKGFTYAFDFSDNLTDTTGTYVSNGSNGQATVPASFLSTPGVKDIGMRVIDFSGGYTDYITQITVNDVAPTVNLGSSTTVAQNAAFTRTGSFTYPGANGPYTAMVDYNFGGAGDTGFVPLAVNSNNTFTLSNTYAVAGNYTVEVKVADASGTTGTGTLALTVSPTNFQVVSFTPTAGGFEATFNRAVNLTNLNLYTGPADEYGAPDITLVLNANTPSATTIEGSLVWTPGTNTADFIQTSGVLAPGTYTVTFVSGGTAFEDTGGNLLAGNGGVTPGTNYVNTFTVAASNVVVGTDNFARGPGQAVNAPYTGAGLPITISNGSGVTAVDFNVDYNPALLAIAQSNAVTLASDLPSGWSVEYSNNAATGVLSISVYGSTALSSGAYTLVDIAASVPATATYGTSAAVEISSLQVNGGQIAATAPQSVEKVAFLGNADGITGIGDNLDVYDPQDAYLIDYVVVQRLAGNTSAGFDAYPLTDPLIIGDVTGDASLSGQDASLVAQEAIGLANVLPAIPNGFDPSTSAPPAGTDPTVTFASNVLGNPGGTVTVPVSIDNAAGLDAGLFNISFDTTKLTLTGVALGGVDPGPGFSYLVNPATGEVEFYATSQSDVPASGSGTILDLQFSIASNAASGITPITVNYGDLNGGALSLTSVNGSVNIETPTVADEYVFYYGSKFDDNDTTPNPTEDFNAVDPTKTALTNGNTATFSNYTSYVDGLNGILIDMANLAPGTVLTSSDFTFAVGDTNTPGTWSAATAPTAVVMGTDPKNGDTAVDIVWANDAIENEWLQVTVLADSNTKLASNQVFYFGNLIGSTGQAPNGGGLVQVTQTDVSATESHELPFGGATVSNIYDFNHDGFVNAADVSIVEAHLTPFSGLRLITPAGMIDDSVSSMIDDTVVSPQSSVVVVPVATSLAYLRQPADATAGALGTISLEILDQNGNVLTGNSSAVTLSILTGPSGATLGGTVTVNAVDGVATFTGLSITKAGTYTLKAAEGVLTIDSASFSVTAAAAARLLVLQQPGNATAGSALSPVTVEILDQYGNLVTTADSAVKLSLSAVSGAALGRTTTVNAVNGVATFSKLTITKAGVYSMAFGDGSLTGAVSSPFTISAAAASQLVFLDEPEDLIVDGKISPALVVLVEDKYGNLVTTNNSKVTIAVSSGSSASLGGTLTVTAINGKATFNNLSLSKTGVYKIKATDGALTQAVSSKFTVGAAQKFA